MSGCRKEKCKLFKNCNVRVCSEEKQVDYCFQCSCFPCENTGFDEHLYKRFVAINKRMQEIGIEKYYEEVRIYLAINLWLSLCFIPVPVHKC
ncbi:DUF3795 domain-containing protein [Bacteroides sp. CR5/BHMF/2]|nr:DUF3795 domain-containing protein [Bacteroides sp. CR5/BHMF/2]